MDPRSHTESIVYYVNGEKQVTEQHSLTVRALLQLAQFTPPEDYRLQRDDGHHTFTNLDEEVHLHENERFTALFQGPTPVS